MQDPKSLQNNILFLTGQITKRVHESVTNGFREEGHDVTVEQFTVLSSLWYEEGINQQMLAHQLDRDKTTIARIVRNMEKKSLLVRIPDKDDQRNKLIYLTARGKELQDKLARKAGEVYVRALNSIDQEDLNQGVRILTHIRKNLE
jgi:DNA-binding MarR family transcriptional regulator